MIRKYVETWANRMSHPFIGVKVAGFLEEATGRYRFDNAPEIRTLMAMSKDRYDYMFEQDSGRVWFGSTKCGYCYCRIGDFLFMKEDGCVTSVDGSLVQNYLNRNVYVVIGELNDSNGKEATE